MGDHRAFLIALACFAGGAVLAGLCGRAGWRGAVWGLRGLAAAGVALGAGLAQGADSWRALGWMLFALIFAGPALAGAVLGGWLGLRLHARR